jgi:NAD(P) transhydrogenase subunit alpha
VSHGTTLVFEVTILVLAIFIGFEVISKVPTLLHTPLMSGTNAIHGIVIVGAMLVLGAGDKDTLTWIIGFVAVVLASANVVGGFVVTDRMLEMFKRRTPAAEAPVQRNAPVRDRGPVEGARGNREVPPETPEGTTANGTRADERDVPPQP